jgi:hypothetical protein
VLIAYVFQPINHFPVLLLLNRNMSHGCGGSRSMPVLFVRRKPDDISWEELFNRSALALRPSCASRHNQRLPKRVRVPCRACAWFKRHRGACEERRVWSCEERIDANGSGEPFGGPLTHACEL